MKLFSKSKRAFGVEIGDSSIKIFSLAKKRGKHNILGHTVYKIPKGLVKNGVIKDKAKLGVKMKEAFASTKPKKVNTKNVITSLPESNTFVRVIEIPKMPNKEIDEAIAWEAQKYVPLPMEKIYLDWQKIEKKNVTDKEKILIAAAPRELVDSYVDFFQSIDMNVMALELEAAAEARSLVPASSKDISLIVDIGSNRTFFCAIDDGIIQFTSSISSISGNFFTKVISEALEIKKSEAEKVKITCCSPKTTAKEQKLLKAVHPAFDSLAKDIEKIIRYYQNHVDSDKDNFNIYLCGGGAGLHNIAPYLSLKLKRKVRLGDPWVNVEIDKKKGLSAAQSMIYAKVIGLALRGVNLSEYIKK